MGPALVAGMKRGFGPAGAGPFAFGLGAEARGASAVSDGAAWGAAASGAASTDTVGAATTDAAGGATTDAAGALFGDSAVAGVGGLDMQPDARRTRKPSTLRANVSEASCATARDCMDAFLPTGAFRPGPRA